MYALNMSVLPRSENRMVGVLAFDTIVLLCGLVILLIAWYMMDRLHKFVRHCSNLRVCVECMYPIGPDQRICPECGCAQEQLDSIARMRRLLKSLAVRRKMAYCLAIWGLGSLLMLLPIRDIVLLLISESMPAPGPSRELAISNGLSFAIVACLFCLGIFRCKATKC